MDNQELLKAIEAILQDQTVDLGNFPQEERSVLQNLMESRTDYTVMKKAQDNLHDRLENILDVLVEFAQFNFDLEIPISDNADELDGIALGLQTLGQEIEFYQKELHRTNENLQEAQKMAKIGSWEVFIHNNEILWSDEMYRIYEVDRNEDKQEALLKRFSKEEYERMNEIYERSVKFHELHNITITLSYGEKIKYIDVQSKPVFDDGELIKIVGTAMDVTERIIAHRKLQALNQDLEEKVAERTKDLEGFSYSVSHDLRAPLRSVLGFSNILAENYAEILGDEGKRLIEIVTKNAAKMATLIEELLGFSRVGIIIPNFQEVDLAVLLRSTWIECLNNTDLKDKVDIEFGELPRIAGASSLLHQVFTNLFSNALKYSSKKDKIVIRVESEQLQDSTYQIAISDNGCGFNMKYHAKLFGVFQRLHSEDEYPGTGVGLALVKRIIEKHQGKIWAESELDKGSTFFVTLPKGEVTHA